MERKDKDMNEPVFSKRLRAGKRTYFIDVKKSSKSDDYYLTLTESKKRFGGDGFQRHKIFLYKEDFNKFQAALDEAIDHVKTNLLPEFDYDSFNGFEDEYDNERTSLYSEVAESNSTSSDDDLSW